MKIRVQPKKIEIREDEPFKYDLLNRSEPIDILTHLVSSVEGPCVLSVDAEWGNGKSTFLQLWSQYLRNNDFPVVELNAWETDYAEDPFAVLLVELMDGLKQVTDGTSKNLGDLIQNVINVGRKLTPILFRTGLSFVPGGELVEPEIAKLIESYGEARFSAYTKARDSVMSFQNNLKDLVNEVSIKNKNKPVLIMIDELDRCRPSYAVELLEVAKHLFSIDRIIFVLAINRAELSHSVKAIYGQDFDAKGYLKRFIDIDFLLPTPNRDQFITDLLDRTNIDHYLNRILDPDAKGERQLLETLLQSNFQTTTISLRQISQAIHRIGIVFASLPNDRKALLRATTIAVILRTIDEDLYHQFGLGKATDLEVVDKIFPGRENSILLGEYQRCRFEVAIIIGYLELSSQASSLLQYYNELISSDDSENDASNNYLQHARDVVELRNHILQPSKIGFKFAISRIELLSDELRGE